MNRNNFIVIHRYNKWFNSHIALYTKSAVYMHLNTLPVVSIYLWHHSQFSCWAGLLHTEFWLNSMQLILRIIHLKERTSKLCIVTNCFKMVVASCFMGPINIFVFQWNFWNSCSLLWITSRSAQLTYIYYAIIPIYVNFLHYIYLSDCSTFSLLADLQVLFRSVTWRRTVMVSYFLLPRASDDI